MFLYVFSYINDSRRGNADIRAYGRSYVGNKAFVYMHSMLVQLFKHNITVAGVSGIKRKHGIILVYLFLGDFLRHIIYASPKADSFMANKNFAVAVNGYDRLYTGDGRRAGLKT